MGATANKLKGGYRLLQNLSTGFNGDIYPVNPRYEEIGGITCYPAVDAIPGPVDLAIVFVPAAAAVQAVSACAQKGIERVMVQSAGFAETGADGRARQEELLRIKEQYGIRIWGPNCMGIVDAVKRHVFSFALSSIWENGLLPGRVSLIVQSGLLSAGFLIDTVTHGTMGISKACSIGNKADVHECDILEYLIDDPETDVIGTYLESIADGRRFLQACRRSPKPVVVLKGGKSAKGAAAAMSHTASLAGDGAVVSGALAQAGVVEADDFKQMLDFCRTLAMDRPRSAATQGRIAVLTYSGGAGIVSADFIDASGLEIADLSRDTIQDLATVFPDWMPPANPVDLWPAVEKNGYDKAFLTAFEAVLKDPNVDAVLYHVFISTEGNAVDLAPAAKLAAAEGKPIFCWLLGHRDRAHDFQAYVQSLGIPVFREIRRTSECMAVYFQYRGAAALLESADPPDRIDAPPSSGLFTSVPDVVMNEYDAKKILSSVGVPTVNEHLVATAEEATACSEALGYPVVMKGLARGRVHKTEENLVRLGIGSADAVQKAFLSLQAALGDEGNILVQRQVAGELELIAGLLRDPQFGPCVMCGFGGVMAEVLNDTAFAVAPLTVEDALALIGRLKNQKLLDGFRGNPALDKNAFARILVRLGDLGMDNPRISEIDINPFIVVEGKPVTVDATIILAD
ncbi:MAG: acetate--CoA ligase family protein [Deltaproteobacteria bacterium]|nr:acetate--CoA ligase family protein [Deltaproteobacteria bacterium]